MTAAKKPTGKPKEKKTASATPSAAVKLIATNPNAKRNYFIEDTLEAGIVLGGTEVKSLRQQSPNISDTFVEIRQLKDSLEAWLINAYIPEYSHGTVWNHEPKQKRKLLLHRKELERLFGLTTQKGLTVVPLKLYFKRGKVKVLVGMGAPKKLHDKRDTLKKKGAEREMAAALKNSKR